MADDRQKDGKFAPGNKLGRGNPFAQRSNELRSRLYSAVTDTDWNRIVARLIDDASDDDAAVRIPSRKELFERLLGKPQGNDILSLNIDPGEEENPFAEQFRANPDLALAASDLLRRMAVDPGGVRVAPEPGQSDAVDLGGSPGVAEPQAD